MIYQQCLIGGHLEIYLDTHDKVHRALSIVRLCRQIHYEAKGVLYGSIKFCYRISARRHAPLILTIKRISSSLIKNLQYLSLQITLTRGFTCDFSLGLASFNNLAALKVLALSIEGPSSLVEEWDTDPHKSLLLQGAVIAVIESVPPNVQLHLYGYERDSEDADDSGDYRYPVTLSIDALHLLVQHYRPLQGSRWAKVSEAPCMKRDVFTEGPAANYVR